MTKITTQQIRKKKKKPRILLNRQHIDVYRERERDLTREVLSDNAKDLPATFISPPDLENFEFLNELLLFGWRSLSTHDF